MLPLGMGCVRMAHFAQVSFSNQGGGAVMSARRPTGCVWDMLFLIPKTKCVAFQAEVLQPSGNGFDVRRGVWRVVGVGVGLIASALKDH